MAIDVSSLQTFTDAELLIIYRNALATGAFRQEMDFNGRRVKVPDAKTVLMIIETLEARCAVDAAADNGGGTALVQYGEKV
jgi:hypothetical protein